MYWLIECHAVFQWLNKLWNNLKEVRSLSYLILISITVALTFGLALFLVDPNIKSFLDGIWSAWATMTHVGFGDVVPTSFLGRLLAAILILIGWVLFSVFTGLVSVALIGWSMDTARPEMHPTEPAREHIESEENRILEELSRLREHLEVLERLISFQATSTLSKPAGPVSTVDTPIE
jgi:voltage-gated potassium channel